MASFAFLQSSLGPSPLSWQQYPLELQGDDARTQVGLNAFRAQRDFSQYQLPDLLSSFAAKGTFHSGRTQREASRLGESVAEGIGDQQRQLGASLSDLATRKVGNTIGASF